MTDPDFQYLFHERLGIIIDGTRPATPDEDEQARREAGEMWDGMVRSEPKEKDNQ